MIDSDAASVVTPTVRSVLRRALFWIAMAVVAIGLLLAVVVISRAGGSSIRLSSTNAAPQGAEALATVLADHGVAVTAASSLTNAAAAITNPGETTLLLYDDGAFLTDSQLERAASLAGTVVLVDPSFRQLKATAPELGQAGPVSGALKADCGLTAATKAGSVSGGGFGYRIIDPTVDAITCFGSGDAVFSLIQLHRTAGTFIVLGTTDALTNEFIAHDGNAALALNLLGSQKNLVWYIPTIADVTAASGPTTADLTPSWVIPSLALLAVAGLAGGLWRGRRFGPLIIENLPVTVRASETMQGRARLYEKSSSRLRALDALRIGMIDQLIPIVGLPRVSTVDEVVTSVATITQQPLAQIRRVLVDAAPRSDVELVRLSDELVILEHAVTTAVRPD